MRLELSSFRYLSASDFGVLAAIEMGMSNHDLVPVSLIENLAGVRRQSVHLSLSVLLRHKLISHENKKYDGYRLTYCGYDYLVLKVLMQRGWIESVTESRIAVGKEADIHLCTRGPKDNRRKRREGEEEWRNGGEGGEGRKEVRLKERVHRVDQRRHGCSSSSTREEDIEEDFEKQEEQTEEQEEKPWTEADKGESGGTAVARENNHESRKRDEREKEGRERRENMGCSCGHDSQTTDTSRKKQTDGVDRSGRSDSETEDDAEEEEKEEEEDGLLCMKLHRLGRVCFRSVKRNRDYFSSSFPSLSATLPLPSAASCSLQQTADEEEEGRGDAGCPVRPGAPLTDPFSVEEKNKKKGGGRREVRRFGSGRKKSAATRSNNWMFLSKLAACKEFGFLSVLYSRCLPVPRPVDVNRHAVLMTFAENASQLNEVPNGELSPSLGHAVLRMLFHLIVDIASLGLVHGDFNEFNILLNLRKLNRATNGEEEGEDGGEEGGHREDRQRKTNESQRKENKLRSCVTLIDFPQMVSVNHPNASTLFDRDVQCLTRFFRRKFGVFDVKEPRLSDLFVGRIKTLLPAPGGLTVAANPPLWNADEGDGDEEAKRFFDEEEEEQEEEEEEEEDE